MKKIIIYLVFTMFFISCGEIVPVYNFDQKAFDKQRQLWLDQDIKNYSFYQRWENNTGGSASTIIVEDGNFAYYSELKDRYGKDSLLFLPTGLERGFPSDSHKDSITRLFANMEKFAKKQDGKRVTLKIEYDSEFHFPSYFYHDAHDGTPLMIGSGGSQQLTLSNFVLDPEVPEETSLFFDREAYAESLQYWKNLAYQNYSFSFSYNYNDTYNAWQGTVTVKNGVIEKASRDGPSKEAVKAWFLPIDGIFAKMEEEADNYIDGGLQLNVSYGRASGNLIQLYYLYLSPESPEHNEMFMIYVGDVKKLP